MPGRRQPDRGVQDPGCGHPNWLVNRAHSSIGKEMLNFFGEENMVAKGIIKIGTKPGYYVVEWTEGGTTKSVERTEV